MGYLATAAGESVSVPITPNELIHRASTLHLSGIEMPLMSEAPVFDGATKTLPTFDGDLGACVRDRGLQLIADYGALLDYDRQHTVDYLRYAASNGARTVRCILSHILCGDRRSIKGGWSRHLEAIASRLRDVLPEAESLNISLAIENHQDATSSDLLYLYEQTGCSASFGVTLDTGNPLAVCEDPVEYAARIGPLIKHVHLKDYKVFLAPEGYRLVRCAVGSGVIRFKEILQIVNNDGYGVLPSIEIAAQATRTIPMMDAGWWQHYPNGHAKHLPAALAGFWEKARPMNEPYSSLWEQGASSQAVTLDEWESVEASVQYCKASL